MGNGGQERWTIIGRTELHNKEISNRHEEADGVIYELGERDTSDVPLHDDVYLEGEAEEDQQAECKHRNEGRWQQCKQSGGA